MKLQINQQRQVTHFEIKNTLIIKAAGKRRRYFVKTVKEHSRHDGQKNSKMFKPKKEINT